MTMVLTAEDQNDCKIMKTSRKLGDTVPSWLEHFLELVLIPEVKDWNRNGRINMEMGIKTTNSYGYVCA